VYVCKPTQRVQPAHTCDSSYSSSLKYVKRHVKLYVISQLVTVMRAAEHSIGRIVSAKGNVIELMTNKQSK